MSIVSLKHRVSPGRDIARRLVAISVALSFFAVFVPVVSASWNTASVMACCIGMEAGHCDSGLLAHEPPPPPASEPMCGLTSPDSITVAETHADPDSEPGAELASLSEPCQMDCGACTASTSRLQRQKDVVNARTFQSSAPGAITRFENLSPVFYSNQRWTRINPRGPPATSR